MSNDIQKKALTPKEAAQYVNLSKTTLQRLRTQGIGIPFIKLSKGKNSKVLYTIKELDKFLSRTQKTS